MRKEKISIIVPCYNEQETLPLFYKEIKRIAKTMKEIDFEFMFVNDGSKDETLDILRELAKIDERVRYISFSRNFGKEGGMYAGLREVTGDYVAIMDADLQDPPEMLPIMYNILIEENRDCVALYSPSHKGYSFIRKMFTNCWYKLIGKISTTEQVPGARDFRLMKRKMVDSIISMKEYSRYTKGIFSFVGFDTKWINYEAPDRVAGVTKWNFWKLFKYALEGILAFSTMPLTISLFMGLFTSFVSMILIITFIVLGIIKTFNIMALILSIFGLLIGLQFIFIGIIGLYLSKTYLEVKERPVYIIKETEKDLY